MMEKGNQVVEWSGGDCLTSVAELSAFVESLVPMSDYGGREKRNSQRHPFISEVTIQQIDSKHQPVGTAFKAMTRNISTNGLSLISPLFVNAPFLIVVIPHPAGTSKRMLVSVRRSRPFRKYYEAGGQFVTEL